MWLPECWVWRCVTTRRCGVGILRALESWHGKGTRGGESKFWLRIVAACSAGRLLSPQRTHGRTHACWDDPPRLARHRAWPVVLAVAYALSRIAELPSMCTLSIWVVVKAMLPGQGRLAAVVLSAAVLGDSCGFLIARCDFRVSFPALIVLAIFCRSLTSSRPRSSRSCRPLVRTPCHLSEGSDSHRGGCGSVFVHSPRSHCTNGKQHY
jgi:hypothetical protein